MRWTALVLAALALAGCTRAVPQSVTTTSDGRVVQVVAVTSPASGTTQRDRTGLVAVLQGLRRA
jgi:hypothetical protein